MDKLLQTRPTLIFHPRIDRMSDVNVLCFEPKQPNLKLKTRPEQLSGYLLAQLLGLNFFTYSCWVINLISVSAAGFEHLTFGFRVECSTTELPPLARLG